MLGHTTITAPYNAFAYLFSAVPRTPVLDTKDFPELAVLRDNWRQPQVIRLPVSVLQSTSSCPWAVAWVVAAPMPPPHWWG